MHILINRTSWNFTLDDRTHFLTFTSLAKEIPFLGTLPLSFTVITCSWNSKSYIFLTVDLSSDHWTSSAKPKAQHIFLGPLSLQYEIYTCSYNFLFILLLLSINFFRLIFFFLVLFSNLPPKLKFWFCYYLNTLTYIVRYIYIYILILRYTNSK